MRVWKRRERKLARFQFILRFDWSVFPSLRFIWQSCVYRGGLHKLQISDSYRLVGDFEFLDFTHVCLHPREMIAVVLYRRALCSRTQWLQQQERLRHYLVAAANPEILTAIPLSIRIHLTRVVSRINYMRFQLSFSCYRPLQSVTRVRLQPNGFAQPKCTPYFPLNRYKIEREIYDLRRILYTKKIQIY